LNRLQRFFGKSSISHLGFNYSGGGVNTTLVEEVGSLLSLANKFPDIAASLNELT